jgi:hypothetical protein
MTLYHKKKTDARTQPTTTVMPSLARYRSSIAEANAATEQAAPRGARAAMICLSIATRWRIRESRELLELPSLVIAARPREKSVSLLMVLLF